ncbi:D-sedoheptulose-7-phosphate isomerase [Arthrobacter burdickii]|uniref:D-sedoheptulose-7-phosphate isomerase n=1 Tax=Arthrobacter burdickii TaxID=3035920 RepID=UPI003F4DFC54
MTTHFSDVFPDTRTAAPTAPTIAPTATALDPGSPDVRADQVRADSHRIVLEHLHAVAPAVESLLGSTATLAAWGVEMADRLLAGQRLLAAGNGGSAAEAQHLTAELVGRFDGEREPFSAISLHAESSAVTAIANDYGFDRMFARQVSAHGRPGDILMLLSTSGKSPNLLHAVEAARAAGITTWALTGVGPNPLTECVDDYVAVDATSANAQEGHLIALHAICRAFDAEVRRRREEQR